jgi:hypothetical protein
MRSPAFIIFYAQMEFSLHGGGSHAPLDRVPFE